MTTTTITPALQRVLDTAARHADAARALDDAYRVYRVTPSLAHAEAWTALAAAYEFASREHADALVAVHAPISKP